jgi:predicted lipid-binding transport protein (Tim44 family)
MWKKLSMVMLALTIACSLSVVGVVDVADAAKSYRAPKKSFNSNTTPNQSSGVNKADPSTAAKTPNATTNTTTTAKPGFFSGGLMKGLLIGGFAGMLFGGLFGNMGVLGNILGLLFNVLVLVALVAVVIKIVQYFRNKRKFDE